MMSGLLTSLALVRIKGYQHDIVSFSAADSRSRDIRNILMDDIVEDAQTD